MSSGIMGMLLLDSGVDDKLACGPEPEDGGKVAVLGAEGGVDTGAAGGGAVLSVALLVSIC